MQKKTLTAHHYFSRLFISTLIGLSISACSKDKAEDAKPDTANLKTTQISVVKVDTKNLSLY